jgi:queuine/archaeosine tRNA-ribosyltransferase
MTLEILRHSGPARLGKLHLNGQKLPTPSMFSVITESVDIEHDIYITSTDVKTKRKPIFFNSGSLNVSDNWKIKDKNQILPDFHVGLTVPRELAEESVKETLRFAKKYPEYGAVIQGSKFIELREKCAKGLEERPLFVIANGKRLLRNPRLLVDVVTSVRETIPPNSALYFPFAPPHMFYMLAYMGVDFFDSGECIIKAREEKMLVPKPTNLHSLKELPCSCAVCAGKTPDDLAKSFDLLLKHNFAEAVKITKEIREAIRSNTLRELVEEKAAGDVGAMAMLRILDAEKQDFLEKYTGVSR